MGAGASAGGFISNSTSSSIPNASDSPTGGQNSLGNSTSTTNNRIPGQSVASPSPADDGSVCLRQWTYCTDLAKHLYEVG